jgi:hypothetical protein
VPYDNSSAAEGFGVAALPDIRWISPHYGFSATFDHIGAPENARAALQAMAADLVGSSGLVAIYIPEGTEDVCQAIGMRGRVVGAVKLLPMPPGRHIEDFFYNDWDGTRRWPIGWPCQAVYAPPVAECPALREHVETLFGAGSFGGYVSQFQRGPFSLVAAMRERLNRDFS